MCGRYTLEHVHDLSERFQARQLHFDLVSTYNVAPSQELPVILEDDDGDRVIKLMQWGLMPRWQRPGHGAPVAPINARAETAAEKPMFRDLIRRRRCLVPASGFYEWQQLERRKQPWFVAVKDQPLVAFAGLYDEIDQGGCAPVASYAVLTTRANALLAPIHDRMPVILDPADESLWLSREVTDVRELDPLLRPLPSEAMAAYPVAAFVNDVHRDGPDLIEPRQRTMARAS